MESGLLTGILIVINILVGALLLVGKLKLIVVYKEDEQPVPWQEKQEAEDAEPVANYVKPVEEEPNPVEKITPKRRSRSARTTKQRPPATPAL